MLQSGVTLWIWTGRVVLCLRHNWGSVCDLLLGENNQFAFWFVFSKGISTNWRRSSFEWQTCTHISIHLEFHKNLKDLLLNDIWLNKMEEEKKIYKKSDHKHCCLNAYEKPRQNRWLMPQITICGHSYVSVQENLLGNILDLGNLLIGFLGGNWWDCWGQWHNWNMKLQPAASYL